MTQSWAEVQDFEAFDHLVLPAWLTAVERWASGPIHRIACPPRPLDLEGTDIVKLPTPQTTASDKPRKLQLVRADLIQMRPPDWLLRGTLERDTLALIFGDPGSGKSFVAIDWACRIATQTPWRGNSVQSGSVVYIAGEGQQGFGRRIRAWSEYNGVDLAGIPLFVAPAIAIPNPTELLTLAKAIDETAGRPALIVLDTLARCFGGGDENSTQDMSQFISACDAIRRKYGSTILVVHHTGHSDKSRARGAIALKAALDAEYRLGEKRQPDPDGHQDERRRDATTARNGIGDGRTTKSAGRVREPDHLGGHQCAGRRHQRDHLAGQSGWPRQVAEAWAWKSYSDWLPTGG